MAEFNPDPLQALFAVFGLLAVGWLLGGRMRAGLILLIGILSLCTAQAQPAVYFTYNNTTTSELYIGGYIHFPKAIADRIKVQGGVVELEDETGWKIRATNAIVTVQYVKLSDKDFFYGSKTFKAKEYPAELYKPVKPDEMRMALLELKGKVEEFSKELQFVKTSVKTLAERPTMGEELKGYLLYFPPMWIVYAALGVLGFLALVGWWYERN